LPKSFAGPATGREIREVAFREIPVKVRHGPPADQPGGYMVDRPARSPCDVIAQPAGGASGALVGDQVRSCSGQTAGVDPQSCDYW